MSSRVPEDSRGVWEDGRSARFWGAAPLRLARRAIHRNVKIDTPLTGRRTRSINVAPKLLASRTSRPPSESRRPLASSDQEGGSPRPAARRDQGSIRELLQKGRVFAA